MNETLISEIKELIKDKGHANLDKDFTGLSEEQKEYVITYMQSGAKYMLDIMPYSKNWVIKRNPNYINHFWNDLKIAIIGAGLTLLVGITLWQLDKRSTSQEIQQLRDKIYRVSDKLDSLPK